MNQGELFGREIGDYIRSTSSVSFSEYSEVSNGESSLSNSRTENKKTSLKIAHATFERSPLFDAILNNDWKSAINRLEHSPVEVSRWVNSSKGKMLPLHCACLQEAPSLVIKKLVSKFPQASKTRDMNGNLPIHYAASATCVNNEVFDVLVSTYPESVNALDCEGYTPMEMIENSPSKDETKELQPREKIDLEEEVKIVEREASLGPIPFKADAFVLEEELASYCKKCLVIIVIGASTEIARKKTFPSLFDLFKNELLPKKTKIYALGKSTYDDMSYRNKLKSFLSHENEEEVILLNFLNCIEYEESLSYSDKKAYKTIESKIKEYESSVVNSSRTGQNRLFFINVTSNLLDHVGEALNESGLKVGNEGWNRFIFEHCYGNSLDNGIHIIRTLNHYFSPEEIFRMDHYMSKEIFRNLLYLRFSNSLFENSWNRNHIQCILITMQETSKGFYTNGYGIIKEVIQHHLIHILSLIGMEAPVKLDGPEANEEILSQKKAVLRSIAAIQLEDVFLGQYEGFTPHKKSTVEALGLDSFLKKKLDCIDKNTPTFCLLRMFIRNKRWEGVPFIFRVGSCMDVEKEEVRIQFKNLPSVEFLMDAQTCPRNELIFQSKPHESVSLVANRKVPGIVTRDFLQQMKMELVQPTDYCFHHKPYDPNGYTRSLLNVLKGNQCFSQNDEILKIWDIFSHLYQEIFQRNQPPTIYKEGSPGPEGIDDWISLKGGFQKTSAQQQAIQTTQNAIKLHSTPLGPSVVSPPVISSEQILKQETKDDLNNGPKVKLPSGDCDIGIFGLTHFGKNLVLNMASHGYKVCVGSSKQSRLEKMQKIVLQMNLSEESNLEVIGCKTPEKFISSLQKPRKVILIGLTNRPTHDSTLLFLTKFMEPGDVIVDSSGLEYYPQAKQKSLQVERHGIFYVNFVCMGIQHTYNMLQGPSYIFGGNRKGFNQVEMFFENCAWLLDDKKPSLAYVGNIGSVNYTHMVQNGVEYAFMHSISEIYDILKHVHVLTNQEMSFIFDKWNTISTLAPSFLLKICSIIVMKKDHNQEGYMIDAILDQIPKTTTGKGLMYEALEQKAVLANIVASFDSRFFLKKDREFFSETLKGPSDNDSSIEGIPGMDILEDALIMTLVCLFSQAFQLLQIASNSHGFDINLEKIAQLWNSTSSSVQSGVLSVFQTAFQNNDTPKKDHVMMHVKILDLLNQHSSALRRVIKTCIDHGIPCPTLMASLQYFDSSRRNQSSANLIQAQRSFIGSYCFERVDKPGFFRCAWTEEFSKNN